MRLRAGRRRGPALVRARVRHRIRPGGERHRRRDARAAASRGRADRSRSVQSAKSPSTWAITPPMCPLCSDVLIVLALTPWPPTRPMRDARPSRLAQLPNRGVEEERRAVCPPRACPGRP